jgi:hypothetical protein
LDTINSNGYSGKILALLFLNLSDENEHGFFQQDSEAAHTTNDSMASLCNT